jgi:peptidylprolyl isomerase
VRKLPAVFATLSLTAVALVGCASTTDAAAACGRHTDAGSPTMNLISVTGAQSAVPVVDVHTPFHTSTTRFADVDPGTGTVPIKSASQMIVLDVSLVSATTGKTLISTPYDGDESRAMTLSQWAQSFPAFSTALHCATAGTRVAVAIAPGGVDASPAQSLGLSKDDSLVAILDLRRVYLGAANGSLVYNSGWGMPAVVRAPGGRPGVIVPDGPAPQQTTVQTLKRGDGAKVTADDSVLLNYTIVNWTDKTVADDTWDSQPQFVTPSSKSKGFQAAVEGQTVGSQVMAVIPKADGSSDAHDTQVAVIDILGIGPAPKPAQ